MEQSPTFRMTRVEVPAWARRPEVHLENLRLSEFQAVQRHRATMLDVVHAEVARYLNTPDLYSEGADDVFPDRSRMTGEYYTSDESYAGHVGPAWVQVSVTCRCLERPLRPGHEDRDYLGLEVWLRHDPADGSFVVYRNTDSSSI